MFIQNHFGCDITSVRAMVSMHCPELERQSESHVAFGALHDPVPMPPVLARAYLTGFQAGGAITVAGADSYPGPDAAYPAHNCNTGAPGSWAGLEGHGRWFGESDGIGAVPALGAAPILTRAAALPNEGRVAVPVASGAIVGLGLAAGGGPF
eukprot:2157813-Amphidinium_carterae.1